MPTILTVDDTAMVRSSVSRLLRGSGIEVLEAATGVEALELLAAVSVDLILLDVMMPEMDGPAMLRALRARGDRTPVIMLTSETSRALVAGALQCGISDYIVKPYRPADLRAKIARVLGETAPTQPVAVAAATDAAPAEPAEVVHDVPSPVALPVPPVLPGPSARPVFDLLLVDDVDKVHHKLRAALPDHVGMQVAVDAAGALARCHHASFRLIVLDLGLPDTDSLELLAQLRALQPRAVFLALTLRTRAAARDQLVVAGFTGLVFKPFDGEQVAALVHRIFDLRDLVDVHGNVVTANGCDPRDERVEEHHARLRPALRRAIERIADGHHSEVIVDIRQVPVRAERTVRMMIDLDADAGRRGLVLRLVTTGEQTALLRRVAETAGLDVFDSVERARVAA